MSESKWYMAGTEGTGKYFVCVHTALGCLGVRHLGGETYRIRLEPSGETSELEVVLTRGNGWKQPGDGHQNRFSTMVYSKDNLFERVREAFKVLGANDASDWNPETPEWAKDLEAAVTGTTPAAASETVDYGNMKKVALYELAKNRGLRVVTRMRKTQLVAILEAQQ